MTLDSLNLVPAYPELFLLGAACLILIADLFVSDAKRVVTFYWALIAVIGSGALSVQLLIDGATHYSFGGMYVGDAMSYALKAFAALAVALTLIYSRQYAADRQIMRGELYVLSLFALLGQMIMISGNNLLVLYLGLELLSLSLYALVALQRDSKTSTEAAMKYFVLGALASGFLLYGMSMIYGATGSLEIADIAREASAAHGSKVFVFGVIFLVVGIGFKFGAVPFHMWVPDVYEGSPTAVTLLIAGAPKLAAFAMTMRLLVQGVPALAGDWQQMFAILAVLSLIIGNITAIAQTNLKRMLAYSTIAQMGFVLLGFMSGVVVGKPDAATDAYSASMFYVVVYVFTTLGTFGIMMLLARSGFECDQISDLKGLNRRSPWMAFVMLLLMFSLAGIPPTVGFYAKLAVLRSVIDAGHLWIAIIAVMLSLIGAFYYLRVVKVMYFDEPTDQAPIVSTQDARAFLALNGAFIIVFGLFGDLLLQLCIAAIRVSLHAA